MREYKDHLINSGECIKNALVQLTNLGSDPILFVIDSESKLIGSITDGDVRRGLISGKTLEDNIDSIIRTKPRFIRKGENDIDKIVGFREQNFRILPILDKDDKVVNVINFSYLNSYLPIDVVIMAGGRGQRLMPLTDTIPKPMLVIGTKPIIEHNIDRLAKFGVENFWLSINYLGSQLKNYFNEGESKRINIQYVQEAKPLGTIGSLSLINNFKHDYILVMNSDLLTNVDYEKYFIEFVKSKADLSIITIPYRMTIPYAVLDIENNLIQSFHEKPTYTYHANGGIYLFKKDVLNNISFNKFFNATDLIDILIKQGKKVYSYTHVGYWLDIGSPQDFEKAKIEINNIIF